MYIDGERNYRRLGSDKTTHPRLVNVITIQQPRFTGFLPGQNYLKSERWPQWKQLFKHFAHWKLAKINPIGSMFFLAYLPSWMVDFVWFSCRSNICRSSHRNPSPGAETTPRCLEKAQGDAGSLQELDIMPRFREAKEGEDNRGKWYLNWPKVQVPKMEGFLNLIAGYFLGVGFSLTYSVYRWVPPF